MPSGGGGGSGTVTSVSVVSANGFSGSVANQTTTPAITLTTSITGILQGNGTAISAATTGNLTDVGTDGITVTGGTGAVLGSGTSISQHVADTTHSGYLSSTDWNTFNGKQSTLTVGNLTDAGTDGITVTGGTGAVIGSGTSIAQHVADATHNGYLLSTDWTTFNGKLSGTLTNTHIFVGNVSNVATDVALSGDATLANTGALTLATVNANVGSFGDATHSGAFTVNAKGLITAAASTSIQIAESQVTNLVTDLAGKQATGNYITALTGDVTASGPGSVAATLATVNANVGSFGDATHVGAFTVNAKGLITAASSIAITGGGGASLNYYSGSMPNATSWTFNTSSFADGTNSGANTLTSRFSSGITVTAAASNLPGLTWTPSASTAVYQVTANFTTTSSANAVISFRLTDGTNVIVTRDCDPEATGTGTHVPFTLTGLYAPGVGTAITVKVQAATSTGSVIMQSPGSLASSIEWSVIQIK